MKEKLKYYYYFYLYFVFKYWSFKKAANVVSGLVSFCLKKSLVKSRPFIASIDPSNVCILKCPLCPTGRGDPGVKKRILRFKDFQKYFDQLKDYLFVVRIYNWGEPFLAKDIFKMIAYAHENNVGVVINSNLNVVNRHLAKEIINSELDYLMVSIDGVTQKSYAQYRIKGDLGKVIKTVRAIVRLKKKRKLKTPVLHWSFLINRFNEEEISRAKKTAQKLKFNLITFLPLSLITKVNEKYRPENKKKWLPEKYISQKGEVLPSLPCYFLWTAVNVNPGGFVFPCCGIYEERYAFGNLNHETLTEIWNNQKFQSARKLFGQDQGRSTTICSQCGWFKKANKE